jgi:outer membrane protein TolC
VYNARDDLAIAKSGYEKAKSSLSLYMGKKIDANTTLESDLLQEAFDSKQNVQKEVLDTNYNLKMDSKTIEKNILLYKSAKAAHYGSLDIVASYNHIDTLNAYDSKLAGITYNIPIYSGGRVSAQAQEAQISSQISQEQKRSRELALKDETETLVLDIKRYNETIEAKKAGLFSAKETQNVLDGRYKAGLATYIEVLDATSLVLNANLGLLEAYYSRALSIDRIEYLKGKI